MSLPEPLLKLKVQAQVCEESGGMLRLDNAERAILQLLQVIEDIQARSGVEIRIEVAK